MTTPNVLLIISDQQRTDTLGFLGRTPCQTPNIDRLAAEGISFDRCITPSPLCAPARASIFTGLYPHQVEMMENGNTLRTEPIFTNLLREEGYHLDYAGKWHLGDEVLPDWFDRCAGYSTEEYSAWCAENGLHDGWAFNDHSVRSRRTPQMSIPKTVVMPLEPSQTNDAWNADHAIRFLETRPKEKPFFLVCGFNGPHPPFKIPEPYFSMYDPKSIPEPPNFGPTAHEPRANEKSYYHALWNDFGTEWEAWKKSVAVYWGFTTMVDAQVGRLLASLEEEGALDDTLVIFTSDHGEMLGQHGLWHKMQAYEEALRVPLVMRPPGGISDGGIRSQAGASLIDITATILSVVGIEPPADTVGVDLSPAFDADEENLTGRVLFAEHQPLGDWHGTVDWRMETDNHVKYVWNRGDLDELYNLVDDMCETNNLIDDTTMTAMVERCRASLRDWMQRVSDPLLDSFEAELLQV